jgi:hypothetical protein
VQLAAIPDFLWNKSKGGPLLVIASPYRRGGHVEGRVRDLIAIGRDPIAILRRVHIMELIVSLVGSGKEEEAPWGFLGFVLDAYWAGMNQSASQAAATDSFIHSFILLAGIEPIYQDDPLEKKCVCESFRVMRSQKGASHFDKSVKDKTSVGN